MTTNVSPAVWYARIFGIVLTIVGILGLAVITDQNTTEQLLGFDVNLTHNLVHLLTGVLGLLAGFWALGSARAYALVLGIVYGILGIWGLIAGQPFDPLNLFVNINGADNWLHLIIGAVGIAAYVMSMNRVNEPVA